MRRVSRHNEVVAALFWAKVLRGGPDECWPWQGYTKPSGHGLTSLQSLPIHAHRKAWILTHGAIRGEFCVNHRCDNAVCCNPDHLYLGTRADNMVDLWAKTPSGERTMGRMRVLSENELALLWLMRRTGKTLKECAAAFNVHIATIGRYMTEVRREAGSNLKADRLAREKLNIL